jgi:putative endonuclease
MRGLYTNKHCKLPASDYRPSTYHEAFSMSSEAQWFVYMLRTRRGSLYTGITTDPMRRFAQHSDGKGGAKSLRGKGPLQLVWQCAELDRSSASRLEARLKRLPKAHKERIVRGESLPAV